MTEPTYTPEAQTLVTLVDAYGAAKISQNEHLIRLVLGQLQNFVETHDITPKPDSIESED